MDKSKRSGFEKLFYEREFSKIKGAKKYNLIILIIILFISYFSLAFLQNYKTQLKIQMDNPFTNWVSLDIPNHKVEDASFIIDNFKERELLDKYSLDTVSHYNIQHIEGINEINQESLGKLRVRSIDKNSDLLNRILNENNIKVSNEDSECWAIINKSIFVTDKRKKDNLFLSIMGDKYFNIPLLGSVNQLPDNCDVLVSEHMMSILQMRCAVEQFRGQTETNNVKVLLRDTSNVELFIDQFEKYSQRVVEYKDIKVKNINNFLYNWVTLSLDDFYDNDHFDEFLKSKGLLSIEELECNAHRACEIEDPYYLTFSFNSLGEVGELSDHLESTYGFKISLHDVKAKENFTTVTRMAMSTAIIIVLLSLSFVFLFIYHILDSHISSIKPSIGTLKAFGLSNEKIIKSYSVICGKLFLQASFYTLILLLIFQMLSTKAIAKIIAVNSVPILITWLLSFAAIFIFCARILRYIFNKTPGDLIYNR